LHYSFSPKTGPTELDASAIRTDVAGVVSAIDLRFCAFLDDSAGMLMSGGEVKVDED